MTDQPVEEGGTRQITCRFCGQVHRTKRHGPERAWVLYVCDGCGISWQAPFIWPLSDVLAEYNGLYPEGQMPMDPNWAALKSINVILKSNATLIDQRFAIRDILKGVNLD